MYYYRGHYIYTVYSIDDEDRTGSGWYAEICDGNHKTLSQTRLVKSKNSAYKSAVKWIEKKHAQLA
jgi:hypothetical protein